MSIAGRQSCLVVLSADMDGVSAQSFIQAFKLAQTAFNLQLVSPNGQKVEFVSQDEKSRQWLSEFRTKSYSNPISFEMIEASRYAALLIPSALGAVKDLAHNTQLGALVKEFVKESKPICAIGMGVAGLFSAKREDGSWSFAGHSMTSASVFELAKTQIFGSLSLIPEDFIKMNGAQYSHSEPDSVHIVVDKYLVTAQNVPSTVIAVQNLILLCNKK